jgi:hypothetical protein
MTTTHRTKNIGLGKILLFIGLTCFGYQFAQAEQFSYQYVSIGPRHQIPSNLFHDIVSAIHGINDFRQVSGSLTECIGSFPVALCESSPFIYENGTTQLLQRDVQNRSTGGGPINNRGVIGGSVRTGSLGFGGPIPFSVPINQAALLKKGTIPKLITPSLDELDSSSIKALNNKNTVLLAKTPFKKLYLYKQGKLKPILLERIQMRDLVSQLASDLNDRDIIAGTGYLNGRKRGYRHDLRTGKTNLLKPLAKDNESEVFAINNRNHVLGISRNLKVGFQRIGLWDRAGKFHTYFVENIPVSETLLFFNNKGLIVASGNTGTFFVDTQYIDLVPKPGVRLKISNLVVNPPTLPGGIPFISRIIDINNRGDMIGENSQENFILLRLDN